MPKIDIKRGTSIQKVGPAIQNVRARQIAPDTSTARALSSFGNAALGLGNQVAEQERIKKDAAYVANTSIEADKAAREISERLRTSQESPEGHTARFEGELDIAYKSLLDNAPSRQSKNLLQSQLAGFKRAGIRSEYGFEKSSLDAMRSGQHEDSLNFLSNKLLRDPDSFEQVKAQHEQSLDALKTFKSSADVEGIRDRDQEHLANSMVQGIIQRDPAEAVALLESGAFDETFTGLQTQALVRTAQLQADKNAREADRQASQAHEQALNEIDLAIYDGEMTPDGLRGLLEDGTFKTPKEFLSRVGKFNSDLDEQADKAQAISIMSRSASGEVALDPTDRNVKKMADTYYQDVFLPSLQGDDPQKANAKTLNLIASSGIIPPTLKESLNGGVLNGTPDQKAQSADLINDIIIMQPHLTKDMTAQTLAMSRKIQDNIAAGLGAEDAVKAAEVQVFEKQTEQYKAKEKAFKDQRQEFNHDDYVDGIYGTIFNMAFGTIKPSEVPQGMEDEQQMTYKTLAVDLEVDVEKAYELSNQMLAASWGVTTLDGEPRYMKFAPEKVYGLPGHDNSWISEQLDVDLITLGIADTENRIVTLDPRTRGNEKKGYMIGEEVNGTIKYHKGPDNVPLVWVPDRTRGIQGQLEEAARKRQSILDNKIKEGEAARAVEDMFIQIQTGGVL